MDELINREEAIRKIELEYIRLYVAAMHTDKAAANLVKDCRNAIRSVIRAMDVADAEYVKHGRWIFRGCTEAGTQIWQCSYCNRERKGGGRSIYCRDCGALMTFESTEVNKGEN